jgi:hypothetical protein
MDNIVKEMSSIFEDFGLSDDFKISRGTYFDNRRCIRFVMHLPIVGTIDWVWLSVKDLLVDSLVNWSFFKLCSEITIRHKSDMTVRTVEFCRIASRCSSLEELRINLDLEFSRCV